MVPATELQFWRLKGLAFHGSHVSTVSTNILAERTIANVPRQRTKIMDVWVRLRKRGTPKVDDVQNVPNEMIVGISCHQDPIQTRNLVTLPVRHGSSRTLDERFSGSDKILQGFLGEVAHRNGESDRALQV